MRIALVHWNTKLLALLQKEWIVLTDDDFWMVARFALVMANHSLLFLLELFKDFNR